MKRYFCITLFLHAVDFLCDIMARLKNLEEEVNMLGFDYSTLIVPDRH